MRKPSKTWVAIGAVIVGGIAILVFLHRNDWQPGHGGMLGSLSPNGNQTYRQSYLNASIASCTSTIASNPTIATKISADSIANYCRCFAEKSVDQISAGDLFQMVVKHSPSPELNAKIQDDAKACAAQYLKHP